MPTPTPASPARAYGAGRARGAARFAAPLACALGLALAVPAAASADEARAQADAAIAKATAFLVGAQHPDGSFGAIPGAPEPGEIGMTGLVIRGLAKLPPHLRTESADKSLAAAVRWLLAKQQPSGSFSPPGTGLATYRTALAITALLAADPVAHQDAVRRARDFLAGMQFSEQNGLGAEGTESPYYGGFGYDATGTKPDADMSNTYLALEALRQSGVPEDSEVWKRAVVFLQRCQNRTESNDQRSEDVVVLDDGGFMYDPALDATKSPVTTRPDGKTSIPSYASMTYAGLMSMLNAHLAKDDPRVQAAWGWIREHWTLTENHGLGSRQNPRAGKQGLFYYYNVLAKTLDAWGEPVVVDARGERHAWAEELTLHLAAIQRADGSWVNDEPRWWEQDPVLVTGYTLLALDVAYPWLGRAERAAAPEAPAKPESPAKPAAPDAPAAPAATPPAGGAEGGR